VRVALVNPGWTFDGSIYFGCREPHLPLELGYAAALLQARGHEAVLFDGLLDGLDNAQLAEAVAACMPDMTVVTTAPTYLFWRCAQPELSVPADFLARLDGQGGFTVAVGPHVSATPRAAMRKLGCDVAIRGECEDAIVELADGRGWQQIVGACWRVRGQMQGGAATRSSQFCDLPAIRWPDTWIAAHGHHHHRFVTAAPGRGAEVEASRGCPYSCSFCAKTDFRDRYRRRDWAPLSAEIEALIDQGVSYVYFADEIFLPDAGLLDRLTDLPIEFGIQTRIDIWPPALLDRLGRAGCVSLEAGVESLSEAGRARLDKRCRASTDEIVALLVTARRTIPFVQANLIATPDDDPVAVTQWRRRLADRGIWANDPVPLFAYPSSPEYRRRWGAPDSRAWERAHADYLDRFAAFSDIQETAPKSLPELEATCGC